MSLVARHLEAAGIPTIVYGNARDIVEQAGVARLLFTDFPLGSPCGRPDDTELQRTIVGMGLDLLERAFAPMTTVQTPFVWSDDESWRDRFMYIDDAKRQELAEAGEARRKKQAAEKKERAAIDGA